MLSRPTRAVEEERHGGAPRTRDGPAPAAPPAVGPEVLAAALPPPRRHRAARRAGPLRLRQSRRRARSSACPPTTCWGDPLPFADGDAASGGHAHGDRPGGGHRAPPRERELEQRRRPVTAGDGRPLTVLTFRDVTDVRVQRRRFTAFATAAANVAYAGSLRGTLDAICAELVETTDLAGAQIFLIDDSGTRMRVHGAAPVRPVAVRLRPPPRGGPAARGASCSSFEALRAGRPVVDPAPEGADAGRPRVGARCTTSSTASTGRTSSPCPLVVRDRAVGALNAYFRPDHDPDEDEIAFLTAMADQAAVAVENARLLAEVRGEAALDERHRLARELHDSACQHLFSMTLHIRAAALDPAAADRPRLLRTLDSSPTRRRTTCGR